MIDTRQLLIDFICLYREQEKSLGEKNNGEVADWYLRHTNMMAEQYEDIEFFKNRHNDVPSLLKEFNDKKSGIN